MVGLAVEKKQRPRTGEAGHVGKIKQSGQTRMQGGVSGLAFGEGVARRHQLPAPGHPADAHRGPQLFRKSGQLPGAERTKGIAHGREARGIHMRQRGEKAQGGEILPGHYAGQGHAQIEKVGS